jgi:DNA mismatch repair protein MutL
VPVNYAAGAFRISGFIQRPGDAQPTGRRTQLFVNGRPFKDAFLIRAAEAGYRAAIHPGDRPSVYLRIEVAAEDVDVNVHPAKLEVRFRDRIGVERVVEEAVRSALGALAAAVPVGDWRSMPLAVSTGPVSHPAGESVAGGQLFGFDSGAEGTGVAAEQQEGTSAGWEGSLLQVFDSYILYQGPDGVIIVDQHSAHERVLYEAVLGQLSGAGAPAQRLLLPLTVDLTDEELDAVESHGEELRRVGFEVEGFGGRTVVVHTVPAPHRRFDAEACFREMVADLARGRFGGWANRLERFAATYACRAAVKAGERLELREMRELLLRLFATDLPPHDVHGRATIVQLPREELERRFGRR